MLKPEPSGDASTFGLQYQSGPSNKFRPRFGTQWRLKKDRKKKLNKEASSNLNTQWCYIVIIFGIACWPTFFSCCLLKQQSRRHSTTGSAWSPLGNADLISQRNVLASVQQVNNKQRTGKTCTPCLQTDLRGRCALCLFCPVSLLTAYQRLEKVYHCLIWCIYVF